MTPTIHCVQKVAAQLGETPLWDAARGLLWWIDIEQPTLWQLNPATGRAEAREQPGTYFGSLALTRSGGLMGARDLALVALDPESGAATPFAATPDEAMPATRLNDGRVDARGRLWIGTMDNGLKDGLGALYRVDADGTMTRMLDDVVVSNGIAFDPDGRHMYFTDTRRYTTFRLTLDEAGEAITGREVFADYSATGDRPDGACVDADGCLWQAFFGGGRVVRYAPDGRIDREIALPVTNPTCLCFGGADLKTLFVTSAFKFLSPEQLAAEPLAGSVFAIEGAGQGVPENLFNI
ncbi:MAG: SMP-30/gluconolactonase/LRE family protein [Vannielia sp.]|uniref:SMP-30/gluconolactonase/LRE family protein n=1 Tax=Rhodobacterales TaxID=204455 RepID=UPI0020942E52|nr:SMP-30/gluconolactonase/LRE family protein [Oceanicola sp. 502str15]MCO6384404.1 SMP-30/gluconolactonase/LRE family protein [Oceanicola sp. 502str15]